MKFEIVKLADLVISMHQGINTVADKIQYQNEGIPIIQSKHITSGFLDLDDTKYVTNERYNFYKEKYNPKKNEILLCNIGTIGKSILVEDDNNFLIAWNLFLIKLNKERIIPKYANLYLNYLNKINYYNKFLTGGTVKFINKKTMSEVPFILPSLKDQIRIAEILTQTENLINQRKQSIALLDELLKSTFLKMFVYNNENKDWLFTEVKNTVEKQKNAIKAGPFGSSLKKEFYVDKGYKIYGQEQVIKDDLNFGNYYINEELYKKLESCKIKEGDILISLVGTYGNISVVPN